MAKIKLMMKSFTEENLVTTNIRKKVIVDSSVYIAFFCQKDSLHKKAKSLLRVFDQADKYLNPLLVSEIATVLLAKIKQVNLVSNIVKGFVDNKAPLVFIQPLDQKMQTKILKVFSKQAKPRCSFADCSIIAQAKLLKINNILSFDKDLKSEFGKQIKFLP